MRRRINPVTMQGEHWTPRGTGPAAARPPATVVQTLPSCRVMRACAYEPAVAFTASELEDLAAGRYDALRLPPPAASAGLVGAAADPLADLALPPVTQRRVVVWRREDCTVCRSLGPRLQRLAAHGAAGAQPPFTVHEVEATAPRLARFTHVQLVPSYDVVDPLPAGAPAPAYQPYGPGTQFRTLANNDEQLQAAFPGLSLTA